ncbi:hypothetical protein CQA18_27585, partial [Enterobacter hormaechei]|uniref:hypothetical protein n=1 Tax=Enterobacter hormaechei TaxID=158836 RepID=UPI000BDCDCD2
QLEFGLFDFRLHAEFRPDQGAKILETLAEIKKLVAVVPSPSWGRFPHAFSWSSACLISAFMPSSARIRGQKSSKLWQKSRN